MVKGINQIELLFVYFDKYMRMPKHFLTHLSQYLDLGPLSSWSYFSSNLKSIWIPEEPIAHNLWQVDDSNDVDGVHCKTHTTVPPLLLLVPVVAVAPLNVSLMFEMEMNIANIVNTVNTWMDISVCSS